MSLQNIIETAFENRAEITPASVSTEVKNAVLETLRQLDSGALRVAERLGVGEWKVNEWAKKAVLLSFRIADNEVQNDGVNQYFDKVPTKFADWSEEEFKAAGFRAVPGAVARRGSFVAKNVVLMPSYVNIGAYVDEGAMVDTWATVGSCAQIGAGAWAACIAVHAPDRADIAFGRGIGAQQPDHRRAGRESLARGVGIVDVGGFPIVQGADDADELRPEGALGTAHVRVQGQAAVARAELLAVQHRVDAFQLVVDVSGVGVYRAFDGQEAHQQLVEAVVVFDGGGFDGGELRKAFQLVLVIPVVVHAGGDRIVTARIHLDIGAHPRLDGGAGRRRTTFEHGDARLQVLADAGDDTVGEGIPLSHTLRRPRADDHVGAGRRIPQTGETLLI